MDSKEIKIETPEFNESLKSVKNPFDVGFIKQEQPEHTPDSYAIKTETPEILIECPSNIKSEISENISNEFDPLEIKDKSHDCKACDKAFGKSIYLQRHIKSVHEGVKNYKCEKSGKCWLCGKFFSRARDIKKHISSVHERIKRHKCDTCGKAFVSASYVKKHINVIHKGIKEKRKLIFNCPRCKFSTNIEQEFKDHMQIGHPFKSDLFKKFMK